MNVINGFCKVNGQEWTFTYNSTLKKDGATCPPGDPVYEEQLPFVERKSPESEEASSPDSANALIVTATAFILSAVVAAVAL